MAGTVELFEANGGMTVVNDFYLGSFYFYTDGLGGRDACFALLFPGAAALSIRCFEFFGVESKIFFCIL